VFDAQFFNSPESVRHFADRTPTEALGKLIEFHLTTHSTNDLALKAGREGAPHGKLFIADSQTGGRGRRGRSWESPGGLSLLFSVLVRPSGLVSADAGWIPLLAGAACAEGLADCSQVAADIKWPNDIVIASNEAPGWRKLGGILCESVWLSGPVDPASGFTVIGIGLNINQRPEQLPEMTKAPPTSVLLETGQTNSRLDILRAVVVRLEQRLKQLCALETRADLKHQIEERLRSWWTPERILRVQSPELENAEVSGSYAGLDDFGRLKLTTPSGAELILADAEVLSLLL